MNPFFGLRIVQSDILPLKWRDTRLPGGYLNHWLIRVKVPVPEFFVNERLGVIYVHPLNLSALLEAVKQSNQGAMA
jgi:hypothetical protein